ncbi:uncharacterized protein TNCV_472391 [Trichonephila clavipes]|nr:uncharacterized protein TNCV_472391 [Trichonephila clavipes]
MPKKRWISFCDITERLGTQYPQCMIVESSDQRMVLQEDQVPDGQVALLRGKTTVFVCMAVAHCTASAAEIRAAIGTKVTQRTVRNRLLQGQLKVRRPVACIPLSPSHCRLRRQLCQARAHWRTEWKPLPFLMKASPALVRMMTVCWSDEVRECLQPNCLRPRHFEPTPAVIAWEAISYNSRSILGVIPNTLTANVYINALPHTSVVTQSALQSVDMLPWLARSPDLSPIENVWDIFGRKLQQHQWLALTVPVMT